MSDRCPAPVTMEGLGDFAAGWPDDRMHGQMMARVLEEKNGVIFLSCDMNEVNICTNFWANYNDQPAGWSP